MPLPPFRPTYARKRIDITWSILFHYLCDLIFTHQSREKAEKELDEAWAPKQTLTTYTVRSALDLLLKTYAFPPGSEILISAVTVPEMALIIALHGLVPIPIDIEADGSVAAQKINGLITPRTKAILIAHLFGSRMSMDEIVALAREKGLVVFEDCAEAFAGREWTGSEGADVSMFSFGAVKTATAFGGAISTARNPEILRRAREIQEAYPLQTDMAYFGRVLKYCAFKVLTDSPLVYGFFLWVLSLLELDHHVIIRQMSRSFSPDEILPQLRKRPSDALLRLLRYRILHFQPRALDSRRQRVDKLMALLPAKFEPVGFEQKYHGYWLFALRVPKPAILIEELYRAGFDAVDGGTSLTVVSTAQHKKPTQAARMMEEIVYFPIDHEYRAEALGQMASVVCRHLKMHQENPQ